MTIQEQTKLLSETVGIGARFRSGKDSMIVTSTDQRGCTLGAGERYTWAGLRRMITIGAVKPESKP